jgi:hypothetical protein
MLPRRSVCKTVHHPYGFPMAWSLPLSSLLSGGFSCAKRMGAAPISTDRQSARDADRVTLHYADLPSADESGYSFLYLEGSTLQISVSSYPIVWKF